MTNRNDLTSSYKASLAEATTLGADALTGLPAHSARILCEASLEEPAMAGAITDRISEAFNSMPNVKARVEAIAAFRFALNVEIARCKHEAPVRWARVMKVLRAAKR